ncbi:hypothetical protein D3C84_397180 [compost metagenome]
MNDSAGAFTQRLLQVHVGPGNVRRGLKGAGAGLGFQRVAGVGQPGQCRQGQQPLWQFGQLVGSDADQFQLMALAQAGGQVSQAITRKHQFLQERAFAQLTRQLADVVVGQDQPTQQRRQGGGRDPLQLIGLEPDHAQLRALAQALRQFSEAVVRAEQHAQTGQAVQVIGQALQGVAAEVEHFQRVCQVEDFLGELRQATRQVQTFEACERSGSQLCKGMHGQIQPVKREQCVALTGVAMIAANTGSAA